MFLEFSPNGRFLAVGHGSPSLCLLDKTSGFYPKISDAMPTYPTSLVWETSKSFYVGLCDGRFVYYEIDLRGKQLVMGSIDSRFRGAFPVTAIALNKESNILAVSVGPEVYVFRRIHACECVRGHSHPKTHVGQAKFCFVANVSNRFNFKRDPGSPPPFPKSICFTVDNTLVVSLCRQHTA